jgi:hypothetical protein
MNNNQVINFDDYTSVPIPYGSASSVTNPCPTKPLYLTYGASIALTDALSINCSTLNNLNQFNIRGLGITINNGKSFNLNSVTLSDKDLIIDTTLYGITKIVAISVYTTNEIPFLFKYVEEDKYLYKKVLFDIFGAEVPNTTCVGVPNKLYLKGCTDLACMPIVEVMVVGV